MPESEIGGAPSPEQVKPGVETPATPALEVDPLPDMAAGQGSGIANPTPDVASAEPALDLPNVAPTETQTDTSQAGAEAADIAALGPVTPAFPAPAEKANAEATTRPMGLDPAIANSTAVADTPPATATESHIGEPVTQEKPAKRGLWDRLVGILGAKDKDFEREAERQAVLRDPNKPPVPQRESDADRQARLEKVAQEAKAKDVSGVAYSAERYKINTGEHPVIPPATAEQADHTSK